MTEIDRYGHPVERVRPERPPQPEVLTSAEIEQIVTLVVAYTRRQPDTNMVQVWAAQSHLGRWTAPEAIRAIHAWATNRGPNDFLEPADVTRFIRADRQDRAMRAENERLREEPEDPATAEQIARAVAEVSRSLGWSLGADGDSGRAALKVACPHCHAKPAERCTSARGHVLTKSPCHPSRADVAVGRAPKQPPAEGRAS